MNRGLVHEAPLAGSQRSQLLPRCAVLLGLPESATSDQVICAHTAARIHRGKFTSSPDRWWELQVEPSAELWLFIDCHRLAIPE